MPTVKGPESDFFETVLGLFHDNIDGVREGRVLPKCDPIHVLGNVDGNGIRRFATDAQGHAYGEVWLGGHYPSLDSVEKHAVLEHTRDGRVYTRTLRMKNPQAEIDRLANIPHVRTRLEISFFGKIPTLDDLRERRQILDRAIRFPLPERIEAVRAVNSLEWVHGFDGSNLESVVGLSHHELGYTSASLGETVVKTTPQPIRYVMHIDIPRGQPALWIGRHAVHPEQRELLLPRELDFIFTAVAPGNGGPDHVWARIL